MRYSLVSREVIADSIETVVGAQGFDGFVAIGGCDKNMPACGIAIARMNRPSVFRGTAAHFRRTAPRHRFCFRSSRRSRRRQRSDIELHEVESTAIPGPGSCGGMYTANTMARLWRHWTSLPNSSAQNAVSDARTGQLQRRCGGAQLD